MTVQIYGDKTVDVFSLIEFGSALKYLYYIDASSPVENFNDLIVDDSNRTEILTINFCYYEIKTGNL